MDHDCYETLPFPPQSKHNRVLCYTLWQPCWLDTARDPPVQLAVSLTPEKWSLSAWLSSPHVGHITYRYCRTIACYARRPSTLNNAGCYASFTFLYKLRLCYRFNVHMKSVAWLYFSLWWTFESSFVTSLTFRFCHLDSVLCAYKINDYPNLKETSAKYQQDCDL